MPAAETASWVDPASAPTEPPADAARRLAARLHLTGCALGLLVWVPLRARGREPGFVPHHAHQAACLGLTLLLLETLHTMLHGATWAVERFLAWVHLEVGDPSPEWMLDALAWAHRLNWGAMTAELAATLLMSLWMAARARAGAAPTWFFAWEAPWEAHSNVVGGVPKPL